MYEMKFERGIYKKKGNRLSNKRTDWKTYRRELLIIEENTKEENIRKCLTSKNISGSVRV